MTLGMPARCMAALQAAGFCRLWLGHIYALCRRSTTSKRVACSTLWMAQKVSGCAQVVEVLDPAVRDRRLDELLRKYHASRKNRILVFVLYKKEASRVEAMLTKRGWKVTHLNHPLD